MADVTNILYHFSSLILQVKLKDLEGVLLQYKRENSKFFDVKERYKATIAALEKDVLVGVPFGQLQFAWNPYCLPWLREQQIQLLHFHASINPLKPSTSRPITPFTVCVVANTNVLAEAYSSYCSGEA